MPSRSPSYRKRFKEVDTMPYCMLVSIILNLSKFFLNRIFNAKEDLATSKCNKNQYICFTFI